MRGLESTAWIHIITKNPSHLVFSVWTCANENKFNPYPCTVNVSNVSLNVPENLHKASLKNTVSRLNQSCQRWFNVANIVFFQGWQTVCFMLLKKLYIAQYVFRKTLQSLLILFTMAFHEHEPPDLEGWEVASGILPLQNGIFLYI